jgi:hypothetical protein
VNLPFGIGADCSRQELVERIDEWLCSDSMKRLVGLFSHGWEPQFAPTASFYDSLLEFVDDRWNSRGVVTTERYATKYKEVPPHLQDEVGVLAHDLGLMVPSVPSYDRYDAVVVPGSQLWSMVMRVGYMCELRRIGILSDWYVGLGSQRSLNSGEIDALERLSLSGIDEHTLMRSIVEKVFSGAIAFDDRDFREDRTSPSVDLQVVFDDTMTAGVISVLNTPNVNGKRPTTGDTFRTWLKRLDDLATIERVLVITQPLYLYQQGAVAIEVLGLENGLDVEVVGASDLEYIAGFACPVFPAAQILQEVNGSVKRLVALRARLVNIEPLSVASESGSD